MRHLLTSLVLTSGALAFSGAAMAADIVRPPPPPAVQPIVIAPATYDWTGHYLGVQGGWETNSASSPGFSANEDGGLAGVYGGFNVQRNNWVWGLDASINWDDAKGGDSSAPLGNSAGPTWKGLIRGRLGVAFNRTLIYATGGAAVMGYKANVDTFSSASATPWGWTAGAGAEWALRSKWTVRVDWAYQDYGTFTLKGPAPVGGTSTHVTANTFTAGLGMKF
jgi:outer membrane immunogenic protein